METESKLGVLTSVTIAANRLVEEKKVDLGSKDHISAMTDLLNRLHQPGALDALTKIMPNGNHKP